MLVQDASLKRVLRITLTYFHIFYCDWNVSVGKMDFLNGGQEWLLRGPDPRWGPATTYLAGGKRVIATTSGISIWRRVMIKHDPRNIGLESSHDLWSGPAGGPASVTAPAGKEN